MRIKKPWNLLLLAGALLAGCSAEADPQPQAEQGAPIVVAESTAGMSITASSAAQERTLVQSWQIDGDDSRLRVRGVGADSRLLVDMSFSRGSDESVTIFDHMESTTHVVNPQGNTLRDEFSAKSQATLAAISADMDTIRQARAGAPVTTTQGFWDEYSCTKCYGVIQFCGNFEPNDNGLLECGNLERCGWCIGFWW
jgi:hypothetical protein